MLSAESFPDRDDAGLVIACDVRGLHVRLATWVVREEGRTVGAVFGPVTATEAKRLVARLSRHDDPGSTAQDLPWAAAALRVDGTVAVTTSMMLSSGLFSTAQPGPTAGAEKSRPWVAATDPLHVAAADGRSVCLDLDFLREFVLLHSPVKGGPFLGVLRTPSGETLRWCLRAPATATQWCGPDTVPPPTRAGPSLIADYRAAFDEVTSNLASRAGAVVTTLSGGLDSAFMVASLARAPRDGGPIQAFCHSPLPEAHAPVVGRWDPDDFPLADAMARSWSPKIQLRPLRNENRIHPLDVAAAVSLTRGWPVSGVGNGVWLTDFARRAVDAGSCMRFFATHGNASFSDSHRYAVVHYLNRLRPWRSLWLCAPAMRGDVPLRTAARVRIVEPLRRRGADPTTSIHRRRRIGLAGQGPEPTFDVGRAHYLKWLTGRLRSLAAANNPTSAGGNLIADPFASRTMIEMAASIQPGEWQRGHADRALARRLGKGRVPDEIRLRRRRGGQARDTLFILRLNPSRLMDSLATTPAEVWQGLGIDAHTLRGTAQYLLTSDTDPPVGWVEDVLRAAAMGEFVTAFR